jgi:integrase/recombinase XerD
MLRILFPRSALKYQGSPFGREMAEFCSWLVEVGYSKDNVRGHLRRLFRVLTHSPKLQVSKSRSASELHRIFGRYCTKVSLSQDFRGTERAYCRFLRGQGRLRQEPAPMDSVSLLRRRYEKYLAETRGYARSTLLSHMFAVKEFLDRSLSPGESIRRLHEEDIERYLAFKSKRLRRQSMQHVVAALRAFLRYASGLSLVHPGLSVIDTPRVYRDELPPRAIPWALVEKLLRSVDRSSKSGWRDYAILHLMAYYGIRPSEIATLRLDAIDWELKTCRVDQRKTLSDLTLPLSDQTVSLLRQYLRHGRPDSQLPQLFLRARRPSGGLRNYAVCDVFYKRAALSGLPLDGYSAYTLRHSFAMRLLDRGVGVKAIGDILGHRSLEATCVYLRLDISTLRSVALPLPREARRA